MCDECLKITYHSANQVGMVNTGMVIILIKTKTKLVSKDDLLAFCMAPCCFFVAPLQSPGMLRWYQCQSPWRFPYKDSRNMLLLLMVLPLTKYGKQDTTVCLVSRIVTVGVLQTFQTILLYSQLVFRVAFF
ncbi:hypothetical protein TNCT_680241 [Trichonephila clavata]|uniref:Uncharacterized protein n=1 Tax=Trichonephila clavata TaxID=2740835 RepID=A0A8X6LVK2_TRICU|nr:hypothetical protein TNCT_680241 [Trichonephila clavata]